LHDGSERMSRNGGNEDTREVNENGQTPMLALQHV
jgi:hypothetical protein